MARFATVDDYIDALPEQIRAVASRARIVIDAALPDASSAIRWAHPTWSLGKDPVCYLRAASRHITFGFWRGAAIVDPYGILESGGQVMAHAKLRTVADVDEEIFSTWLRQARDLHRRPS